MTNKQGWIIGGVIISAIIFFMLALVILIIGIQYKDTAGFSSAGPKIAIVELQGVIYSSKHIVRQF